MFGFSMFEWIAAFFRNRKRTSIYGGKKHSLMMKVYDNGMLRWSGEVDTYETIASGRADIAYVVKRVNSYVSQFYGHMIKAAKLKNRENRRNAK